MSNPHPLHRSFVGVIVLFTLSLSAKAQTLRIDTIACTADDSAYTAIMIKHEGQLYNQAFNTHNNDTATIRVVLYGNLKTYKQAVKATGTKQLTNGSYIVQLNKCLVFKNDLTAHTILSAASNNLLQNNYPGAPRWLTEGFASVVSYMDDDGKGQPIYVPLYDYNKQVKDMMWNKSGEAPDMNVFDYAFMDNNPDWNGVYRKAKLQALSYGVVYFLVVRHPEHLAPVILALKQGHTAQDALAAAFGTFEDFKSQFSFYYKYSAKSKFSM
jgi:hypothetical protein